MINKRYKKIVLEIFDNIHNYELTDMKVTNICEIFICKLHEAFSSVRKSSIRFHDIIATETCNHKQKDNSIQEFNDEENEKLQKLLENNREESKFLQFFIKVVVQILKYANSNISNIKDIYARLGINDPVTFMSSIDYASNNINNKDGFREGFNIIETLYTKGHEELAFNFIRFLSSKYKNEFIINICKNNSQKQFTKTITQLYKKLVNIWSKNTNQYIKLEYQNLSH